MTVIGDYETPLGDPAVTLLVLFCQVITYLLLSRHRKLTSRSLWDPVGPGIALINRLWEMCEPVRYASLLGYNISYLREILHCTCIHTL